MLRKLHLYPFIDVCFLMAPKVNPFFGVFDDKDN